MGDVNIYLIPEARTEDARRARADVVRLLRDEGTIDEQRDHFYPASERSECYVVGSNHLAAFDLESDDGDFAFQTCEIYGHAEPTIVPQVPGVQPSCPACGADVSGAFYEFIAWREDFLEPMTCPACGRAARVDALKDDVGIFLTNLYVCFCEASYGQIKPLWLQQFSGKTGIPFRMLSYWYT